MIEQLGDAAPRDQLALEHLLRLPREQLRDRVDPRRDGERGATGARAALVLLLLLAGVTAPRWWAVLRRVDLPGALHVAVALGSLVLTFASSDPEKEVVGPWGLALLPLGTAAVALLLWWHQRASDPLIPRHVVGRRGLRSLLVSLLVGASLVAVVVDVPVLARLTLPQL